MKNLVFTLFFLAAAQLMLAQAPQLSLTPAQPKPGQTIHFEYDIAKGPLKNATEPIEVSVLEYVSDQPGTCESMLQYGNGKISGQFTLSPDAKVAVIAFQAGEQWDNNQGEGYFVQMHNAAGKVMPQSLAAQALLYRDWGSLLELNRKAQVAYDLYTRAFAADPKLRSQYCTSFVSCLMSVKRGDEGKAEALAVLDEVSNSASLSENDQSAIARLYDRLSAPEKATKLRDDIAKKFPQGTSARQISRQKMRSESDLAKLESAIQDYSKTFPSADSDELSELYTLLGSKAAEKKDWDVMKKAASKMSARSRASLYNNIAWQLAEENENLEQARMMAAEATEWAKSEMLRPEQAKPSYMAFKSWERSRKSTFAQYADTYAFILDKLNDPQSAASYQAQVVEIMEGKESDMNERYANYLEHTNAPDLRYRLEGFIIHGQATENMKEQFKRLYASEDKSTAGTEAYLAGLEKIAKANRKKEIAAKMMDQPGAGFRLTNLDGKEVSLESLKGKVVIIDFWATWCGPCKASFPGMQQALNNYKDDPNVAFVFIDSWERGGDKAKNASDFIQSKGYTFNVLLDLDDQVITSYGVSGIPTKFVLDKSGKIRFKSIGYSGSSEALVEEISAMIDLAKEQP